jgi:hypothetical protein
MNLDEIDEVFSIKKDYFELNPSFKEKLRRSNNPVLIAFQGKSRAGKSTRLNQLITRKIRSTKPFVSKGGALSVTKNFQYYGPISLEEFGKIHNINLINNVNSNSDIFVIDAEGMDHIDGSSNFLRAAMFAISQMAYVNVIMLAALINQNDIRELKSFFGVSKRLKNASNSSINPGTVIFERTIGIDFEYEDGTEEFESARKIQDETQKGKILELLNQEKINCDKDNLVVLCQPDFDYPLSYWLCMDDFIHFVGKIIQKSFPISGSIFVDLFSEVIKCINGISDFDNPDIPFEQIFQNLIINSFLETKKISINYANSIIPTEIEHLEKEELKSFSKSNFREGQLLKIQDFFLTKANELFPNITNDFPDQFEEYKNQMIKEIDTLIHVKYLQKCIIILIPSELNHILKLSSEQISTKLTEILPQNIKSFNFKEFLNDMQKKYENIYHENIHNIYKPLIETSEFSDSINIINKEIDSIVTHLEALKNKDFEIFEIIEEKKNLEIRFQKTKDAFEHQIKDLDLQLQNSTKLIESNIIKFSQLMEKEKSEQKQRENDMNTKIKKSKNKSKKLQETHQQVIQEKTKQIENQIQELQKQQIKCDGLQKEKEQLSKENIILQRN